MEQASTPLTRAAALPAMALLAALGQCRTHETTARPATLSSTEVVSPAAASTAARPLQPATPGPTGSHALLAPLRGDWLEPLPLENQGVAYVTPPVGASEPRPLMVAVHGAGDRPEWACGGWRLAASEYAFVVCPRGLPMGRDRFAWDRPATIAKAVEDAIRAARARFGAYIAAGPVIYLGFSQGATLAGQAVLSRPGFARVALAEGGYALAQNASFLERLRANGTERALLVCGSTPCFASARGAEIALRRAGIAAQVGGDERAGHNLNQRMQIALRAAWPAFVRGLPNWSGFSEHLASRRQ